MKKEWTGWILLAGAILIGLLAFWLVRHYLDSREAEMRQDLLSGQQEEVRVIVARNDLVPGDVISESSVAVAEIPGAYVPDMAIKPQEFGRIQGRVIDRSLSAGEMLQADFITGLVIKRFSGLLSEGERAISLEVSSLQTYSGMLLPGDFVDLYVLLSDGNSGNDMPRLVPVLERVKVLAAGAQPLRTPDQSFQRLDANNSQYGLITVGLPRERAERLALAREAGDIVFFMRNADDDQTGVADQSYALFGDDESSSSGYWYISSTVPNGERRLLGQAAENAEQAQAGTSPLTPVSASSTASSGAERSQTSDAVPSNPEGSASEQVDSASRQANRFEESR